MTAQPEGRGKRRRWLWAALSLLIAGIVTTICWPAPKRPTYEGKTVEELLLLLQFGSGDFDERQALIRIGAAALPDLDLILSRRPNKWRDYWNRWTFQLRLAASQPVPLHQLKHRAIRGVCILAESGNVDIRPLLPQLTSHTRTTEFHEAYRALAGARDEGISVLTNLLFTGDVKVRRKASWGLRFVKEKPQVIAALLRSATVETNSPARAEAFGALKGSSAPAEQIVPLGLQLLGSDDPPYVRWMAAYVLADYRSITEVSNALRRALSDPDVSAALHSELSDPDDDVPKTAAPPPQSLIQ